MLVLSLGRLLYTFYLKIQEDFQVIFDLSKDMKQFLLVSLEGATVFAALTFKCTHLCPTHLCCTLLGLTQLYMPHLILYMIILIIHFLSSVYNNQCSRSITISFGSGSTGPDLHGSASGRPVNYRYEYRSGAQTFRNPETRVHGRDSPYQ